jgi:protein-S-isoprenylcysteine O-methyltransferase Ste14
MNRTRAAAGSVVFLIVAPGVVAGLVPWLLTHSSARNWWPPVRVLGAILLVTGLLVIYAIAVGIAFVAFVRIYEEPALARRDGGQYDAYREAVPAWWPRSRPWRPDR